MGAAWDLFELLCQWLKAFAKSPVTLRAGGPFAASSLMICKLPQFLRPPSPRRMAAIYLVSIRFRVAKPARPKNHLFG
jgi:hypothetical protein